MGFFSWQTADTQESIPNIHSGHHKGPVYLLQPHGKPPIREPRYDGYGDFNGISAYEWLAKANLPQNVTSGANSNELYLWGVSLALGEWYVHAATGKNYTCFEQFDDVILAAHGAQIGERPLHLGCRFDEPLDAFSGQTMNEAIAAGTVTSHRLDLPYPLKFSFDPEARYEDLPASQNCPQQGFFYDDSDDNID